MKLCLCGKPPAECFRNRGLDNIGEQFHDGKNGLPYFPDPCVAPPERTIVLQKNFAFPVAQVTYAGAVEETAKQTTEFTIREHCRLLAQLFRCNEANVMRDVRAVRARDGHPKSIPNEPSPAGADGGYGGSHDRESPPNNVHPLFPRRDR